ncbi:MAG: phosphatase PAP2 family protein [Saprospiraceae bacterium]|nr:phosphatase PAP2 family protein [Saprospiraceae bacterium]
MKQLWKNNWFLIPTLIFFGVSGILISVVPYGHEILFFNEYRREPYNSLFHALTLCGEAWAFVFFGAALLFRRPPFAVLIAITGILTMPISYWAKDKIGIDRPVTYFEKNRPDNDQLVLVPNVELNRGQTSFPSGHSMAAFALYGLLALMLPSHRKQWGLLLAIMAIFVGISRIFLVQHFLADVLGGAFLGLLLSSVVWSVYHKTTRA